MDASSRFATSSQPLRHFVSSLITSLGGPAADQTGSNPLQHAPAPVREKLLALHVLFPNELLPALDVLDRGLVTRLRVVSAERELPSHDMFLVRSAQQPSSSLLRSSRFERQQQQQAPTYYEVRLIAWSCSCPGFAFSAFPPQLPPSDLTSESLAILPSHDARSAGVSSDDTRTSENDKGSAFFGGLTRGADLAVCKHLLACALAEHCPMMANMAEEREVSIEEVAGWAAGWGD